MCVFDFVSRAVNVIGRSALFIILAGSAGIAGATNTISVTGLNTNCTTSTDAAGNITIACGGVTPGPQAPACSIGGAPGGSVTPGTPVTLTANCSNSPTSYRWSNGSNATVSTSSSYSFNANASDTYTLVASNSAGSSTPTSVAVTVGSSAAGCSGYSNVQFLTFHLNQLPAGGNQRLTTIGFTSNPVVASFTTGAWTGAGYIRYGEYNSGPITHKIVLSTSPCDFSNTTPGWYSITTSATLYYLMGSTYPGYPTLQPNTTYYINAINQNVDGSNSCINGICDIFIEVQRP